MGEEGGRYTMRIPARDIAGSEYVDIRSGYAASRGAALCFSPSCGSNELAHRWRVQPLSVMACSWDADLQRPCNRKGVAAALLGSARLSGPELQAGTEGS